MERNGDGEYRVLVVAADPHVGEALDREIASKAAGRTPNVRIVAPALTETAFQHAAGAVDEGMEAARARLEESIADAESEDSVGEVAGRVGDADPMLAIDDALFDFPADEIIVVTHADDEDARWMEDDLFDKAQKQFEPPVSHFVIEGEKVAHVDEGKAGTDPSAQDEVDPETANVPPLAKRDVAGILIALAGTAVLWIIATSNPDQSRGDFDWEALHLLVAGAVTLINLAHIVGLMLFESVGYRGLAQRFFSSLSLYGTLAAVAVSLLLLVVT